MFRNQYDTDVTTWSPAGRLHQVEYAMEAVKQGSPAVGVRSNTHVVLATLKRSANELASYQKKLFRIDDHVGIAIAGLTADARMLSKWMRTECLNHKFVYTSDMQTSRLAVKLADKAQVCTQRSYKRPFGVGLLIAGYDQTGSHLFQTCPSGNFYEYKAMAIGARSQSAKTYLEKNFEAFADAPLDVLTRHALLALRESSSDNELTPLNCSLAIVGVDRKFEIVEGDALEPYLAQINNDEATDDAMES